MSMGTPFGHVTAAKYAKAMKYNYANENPGAVQEWGEVYNFVNPTDIGYSTTVDGALITPDTRVKRWFPGQLGLDAAQAAWAITNSYATDSASYKTSAESYNKYFKDVKF